MTNKKTKIVSVTKLIPSIKTEGLTLYNPSKGINYDVNQSQVDKTTVSAFGEAVNTDFPGHDYQTTFAYFTLHSLMHESCRQAPITFFNDQIVVDLGSGAMEAGYLIAEFTGASSYIAVDPFCVPHQCIDAVGVNPYMYIDFPLRGIPAACVREDMLSFLKRLPDNSVSVLMSGIDELVMASSDAPKYREQVTQEIYRVLNPNGGFLQGFNNVGFYSDKFNVERSSDRELRYLTKK